MVNFQASNMVDGSYCDIYIGKDCSTFNDVGIFGIAYKNDILAEHVYLGIRTRSPKLGDTRLKLYGSGVMTWEANNFEVFDNVAIEGNITQSLNGKDGSYCGGVKHVYSTTSANNYVGLFYQGQLDALKCYKDGKNYLTVVDATATGTLTCNNYKGYADADIYIDSGNFSGKSIRIGQTYSNDIYLTVTGQKINCVGDFFPTPYASATFSEGVLTYDNAIGEKCLKFYNGSGWITLGKSGSNDIVKTNAQDIKINKIVTKKIEPPTNKEVVEISNLVINDNTSQKAGSLGFDDLGFYALNKTNMKIYFAGNNPVNNKHKIDPRLYAYLNDRFKILNEKIDSLENKITQLESKKNDDTEIDFSKTNLQDSFMDLTTPPKK